MFLATTALVELWDKDDDILVLGPWCLRYDRRAEWEGLRYTVLPNPWATNEAVVEAEAYCGKVISILIDGLAEHLNALHGVRFDRRYWQILIGPWLLYYAHAMYDRYIALKRATDSYPKLRTVLLSPASYRTPIDTDDFLRRGQGETSDVFNLQLYSQILYVLHADLAISREVSLSPENPIRLKQEHLLKTTIKRMLLALARTSRPGVMLSAGMQLAWWQWARLIRAMACRGGALPFPQALHCEARPIDQAKRKGFRDIPATDEFTRVLVESLPDNVPQIFVEGYAEFREASLKLWPVPPKVIVSATGWYGDEAFKFLAGEFGERGSRLVGVQNGGGYGTSKVHPPEKLEVMIVDRWFSLGWRGQQPNDKIQPLPHPKFLPLPAENTLRRQLKTDVLLVTTSHPRYPYRFESFPTGKFDVILEWRSRFIHALPSGCQACLVVRIVNDAYGWCQEQRLVDTCGKVRFDKGQQPLNKVVRQARLVVIEYYGTAYLELLAANVPTVLFWDPGCWEVRRDAEPYFEALRKAGILFDSPEAAAAKVSVIYEDPWVWWGSDAVQEARRFFVNRYALGRKDWVNCWVKALEEEMALSQAREQ